MGRIVQTGDTPAKRRHRHMRSCAEVIRLLAERSSFDDEAKDMAAFLVYELRGIYETIDESAHSWDERNYWKKAENLRQKWRWAHLKSEELGELVVAGKWQLIPPLLIELIPQFTDITVTSITRDSDWWAGARRALLKETGNI
ncbi:MAG: hypothetical protein HKN17_06900 [Rhodothermales bacterium]|nr:hypothetical protein [Rhodothermales bacterium]